MDSASLGGEGMSKLYVVKGSVLSDLCNWEIDAEGDNFVWAFCSQKEHADDIVRCYNAHDALVAERDLVRSVLQEARRAIVVRMNDCDGLDRDMEYTCTCDWCGDDAGLISRIDKMLREEGPHD